MPYALKQFFAWATFDGCRSADEIGPEAKECDDHAVPLGAALVATIDPPAVRAAWIQRGGGRGDVVHGCPTGLSELSACRPIFWPACQDLLREIGLEGWRLTDVDGPQGTTNREKILRIGNFLMAEKLGPGAVGGIAEIVGQFAGSIPSACGLR